MKLRKLSILGFLALAATSANATNYYVSPTGGGDGKSIDSPATLTKGLQMLSSGDSLFLKGGQYDLKSGLSISRSGKSAEEMTFIGAVPGEKPVLDFRNQPHKLNGVTLSGSYIHLKGITIQYAGYKGLINNGSYNTMELLVARGNSDTGIQQKNGKSNLILNCDSYDNFDYMTGSIGAADWGGNADGFADKQYTNSPGNTYIGCRSWNNSDDGWDHYQRVGGTTLYFNCICYKNGPAEYNMSNHPRRNTDASFFDQFDGNGITITLKGGGTKSCSLEHFYNNGNGNGFKLGGGSTQHDVTLYRCLSVGNTIKGFDQNSDAGEIRIYNCTSYNNGQNYGFYNNNGYSLDIRNCISLKSKKNNTFTGSKISQSNNSWNTGFSVSDADFESLDETQILGDRQEDGSLPEMTLLHLKANSKLVNAGTTIDNIEGLQVFYNGSAADLGCYETGATTGIAETAIVKKGGKIVVLYDANGRQVKDMQKGNIYIARYDNGDIVKIAK